MMIRRVTQFLLVLSLFFGGALTPPLPGSARAMAMPSQAAAMLPRATAMPPAAAAVPSPISIVQADDAGIVLAVSAPDYQVGEETIAGDVYQTLQLPGASATLRSGAPQLPLLSATLGVPADADISIQILATDSQMLPATYPLRPAPIPVSAEDELSAGTLAYIPDPQAYTSEAIYPPHVAEITGDGWLRDQRLVTLAVYPFQYQAASGKLTWHKHISLRVVFERSKTDSLAPQGAAEGESPFEASLQNTLLNYEQARAWRDATAAKANLPAARNAQALPTRYKIVVEQDGLYRLTYNDILQAGIPTSTPANWRLTNLGDTVTMMIAGEADGSFDPGDELVFYGEQLRGERFAARYSDDNLYWLVDNCAHTYCPPQVANYMPDAGLHAEKYTRENVYWLEIENTPQPRWNTYNGTPGSAPVASYFTDTVRAEQSNTWWVYHFTEEDSWFWERAQASFTPVITMTTRNYPTTLVNVANVPFTATVRGDVVARTSNPSINPDHRARFRLNNNTLIGAENIAWDGPNRIGFEGQISQNLLLNGSNQLNFTFYGTVPSGNIDEMYFNWFEVEYARSFQAVNNELWFQGGAAGNVGFRTSNFSNDQLWALDITNPLTPTQITQLAISGASPYTVTFEANQPAGARYYLSTSSNLKTPKSIHASTPPDLLAASNGADYIFITHQAFITPTQELADYRASQGLRTKVVDIADIYDLFSDGIFNPIAIKNFLGYAYANWQGPAPLYGMLVGDGHWNFFGYAQGTYGAPRPIYLPPYLVLADPWQGEVDSSNLLAAIVGNDALPDLLIGRAVVSSEAEMQAIVDKIKAYEASPAASWQANLSFVAENTPDPAGDFVAEHEEIISSHVPAGYSITRLYQNTYGCTSAASAGCTQIRNAITNTINITGTLIMSYAGHGSPIRWSSEEILTLTHVPTLNNASQLPIMLDMTCLTGYYISAYTTRFSLAAELVRSANKGAIAAFAPTGLGIGTGHSLLHSGFFDAVFKDEVRTLGAAALASKMNLYANHYYFDLLNTFTVFGDPALKLPVPLHQPNISAQNAQQDTLPGNNITYALTVRNAGSVTDTFTLAAQGNTWPAQLSSLTTAPLAPGAEDEVTVTVQAPLGAIHGDHDTVNIVARSATNAAKTDQQALVTSVKIQAGVAISPSSAAQNGLPGETVTYSLRITNTGEIADTFSAQTNSGWNVTLTPSSPFGPLAPGSAITLTASVSIPPAASNGDFNAASIHFHSKNNPAAGGVVNLLTSVYIPSDILISPANAAQDGLPGQTITYTLLVTNAGSLSDQFSIQIDGPWQATLTPAAPIGPLAAGSSQRITLSVTIPLTATNGSFATSSLTFRSQNNPDMLAVGHYLANVAIRSGVAVSPTAASKQGTAGSHTTYELTLTNTGNFTDTFTIETNGAWPITLTPAATTAPIPPGGKSSLLVTIGVPTSAQAGDSEIATITVLSQNTPSVFARALLETRIGGKIYLPIVVR